MMKRIILCTFCDLTVSNFTFVIFPEELYIDHVFSVLCPCFSSVKLYDTAKLLIVPTTGRASVRSQCSKAREMQNSGQAADRKQ